MSGEQEPSADTHEREGAPDALADVLVIEERAKHHGEGCFDVQHQPRARAARALQPPRERSRGEDRAEERDHREPREVACANRGFDRRAPARRKGKEGRTGVEKRRGREHADAVPEALNDGRRGAERRGGDEREREPCRRRPPGHRLNVTRRRRVPYPLGRVARINGA